MTYLRITDSVPAAQIVTAESTAIVNFEFVQSIERLVLNARRALDSVEGSEKEVVALKSAVGDLATAVGDASVLLGQIVRGLERGDLHVINYPSAEAYAEAQGKF